MTYDNLFEKFKEEIPEGMKFYEKKMKECGLDETDGKHVIFGMVIVPYIFHVVQNKEEEIIEKVFLFLEEMDTCGDVKVQEVLGFTILEQIIDEGPEILQQYKQYMRSNTLEYCELVEQYFRL